MRVSHRKVRRQEERTAKRLDGRRKPGSGNRWYDRGDSTNERFVVDNKRTDKRQYILKAGELEALCALALAEGKEPMLQLDMAGREWALISMNTLLALQED